jgi:uncharacterized protein (DUF2141 family)
MRFGIGAVAAFCISAPAVAADLTVRVTGIGGGGGTIQVSACTEAEFLKSCRIVGSTPAKAGSVSVTLRSVPPGSYAIQAFHDRNGDGKLATGLLGLPSEPFGLSRSPTLRFGPPAFGDAVLKVEARPITVPVALN